MATILLSKGQHALVDEADLQELSQWNWCFDGRYAVRGGGRDKVRMHVHLMSPPIGFEVDHRNGDKLDNRRENLRIATHAQNNQNKKFHGKNTSGVKGVSWHKQRRKWQVKISVDGKQFHVGLFLLFKDAVDARHAAAKKHHKEFANE